MVLTEGQMSDYKGAALMLESLPAASELLADKGYDADWFREALQRRGITPCIPPKANRKANIPYYKGLYKSRARRTVTVICGGGQTPEGGPTVGARASECPSPIRGRQIHVVHCYLGPVTNYVSTVSRADDSVETNFFCNKKK